MNVLTPALGLGVGYSERYAQQSKCSNVSPKPLVVLPPRALRTAAQFSAVPGRPPARLLRLSSWASAAWSTVRPGCSGVSAAPFWRLLTQYHQVTTNRS